MTRDWIGGRLARAFWYVGWPLRQALLIPVRIYRVTVGKVVGGTCRFYPSCSAYAEAAIGRSGVVRGLAFTAWRVLRCSPLSAGGVDMPPVGATWRALHEASVEPVTQHRHVRPEVAA